MNTKLIKVLGVAATVAGAGISILSSWLGEKQQDAKIEEKVLKALAEKSK